MKDTYDFAQDIKKRQVIAVGQAVKDRFGDDWDVDTLRDLLDELVMNQVFTLDVALKWLIMNVDSDLVTMIIRDWVWSDVDGTIWKRKSWEQRRKELLEDQKDA
jgi:hypothetical protein